MKSLRRHEAPHAAAAAAAAARRRSVSLRRVLCCALAALVVTSACTSAPEPVDEGSRSATGPGSAQEDEPGSGDGIEDEEGRRTLRREALLPPEPPPWQRPVFESHPFFPFLDGERVDQSVSIGTTRDGWLYNGTELPEPAANYQTLPVQYERGLRYGTEELIHALTDAADAVAAEFPRSLLYIGNIGDRHGGDIPYSVSHNNGRDVDIAFYSVNPYGWQTRPQTLLTFDKSLHSIEHSGFYRFDVERNAALVEALVTHPEIQVQYMFMANHLAKPVLEAVKRRGRLDASQLAHLAAVLYQPRGAAPHDDHLHLRIYCAGEDVCGGCVNDGKLRDGIDTFASALAVCTEEFLTVAATDSRAGQRANALYRLALLDAEAHASAFLAALGDAAPEVRVAALQSLGGLSGDSVARAVVEHDRGEGDASVRCAAAVALGRISAPAGNEHLATLVAEEIECPAPDGTGQVPLAQIVAEALSSTESHKPVAALIERLSDARPEVRAAAARALRRLTNRADDIDWQALTPDSPAVTAAIEQWRSWHTEHGKKGRDAWLVAGFQAAGYPVKSLDVKSIEPLLDAVRGPEHISYNAQRVLMRISKTEPPSLSWPASDAAWHWTRYFKKNQKKFRIDLSDRPER